MCQCSRYRSCLASRCPNAAIRDQDAAASCGPYDVAADRPRECATAIRASHGVASTHPCKCAAGLTARVPVDAITDLTEVISQYDGPLPKVAPPLGSPYQS
jgi:hypothetical protein